MKSKKLALAGRCEQFAWILLCATFFHLWSALPAAATARSWLSRYSTLRKKNPSEKRYSFIRYDANRLVFFSGMSPAFQQLFSKIDGLASGKSEKVRIVHFGGSHVQADVWTGEMRRRLREWFPNCEGERGLIFPQKLARSNGSPNFKVNYSGRWRGHRNVKFKDPTPLGVAGVAASTSDSLASLEIILTGQGWLDYPYPQYHFSRIKVFHNTESDDYDIEPVGLETSYQKTVHKAAGYTEFQFSERLTRLGLAFRRKAEHGTFLLRGLVLENDAPGFSYSAIGVNGATVHAYLRCEHLPNELATLSPDLVVFSIGVNDTRGRFFDAQKFEQAYESLLQHIKAAAPSAALLFVTNSDNLRRGRKANANTLAARQVMLRLAARHNAAVWDLFEVMGGLKSFAYWQQARLAKRDRVHFNHDGYTLLGDLFFEAFERAYAAYQQARRTTQN